MLQPFCGQYRGYQAEINEGRAILPRSALRARASASCPKKHHHYGPLIFRLYSPISKRRSHCAAQSFTAEEGTILLPKWMMENLQIKDGNEVFVERACLPYATFCKLETRDKEIKDVEARKAALESYLRKLCCLTTGDVLSVAVRNGGTYKLRVVSTRPGDAVNITDCDIDALVAELRYYETSDITSPITFLTEITTIDSKTHIVTDPYKLTGHNEKLTAHKIIESKDTMQISNILQNNFEEEILVNDNQITQTSGFFLTGTYKDKIIQTSTVEPIETRRADEQLGVVQQLEAETRRADEQLGVVKQLEAEISGADEQLGVVQQLEAETSRADEQLGVVQQLEAETRKADEKLVVQQLEAETSRADEQLGVVQQPEAETRRADEQLGVVQQLEAETSRADEPLGVVQQLEGETKRANEPLGVVQQLEGETRREDEQLGVVQQLEAESRRAEAETKTQDLKDTNET